MSDINNTVTNEQPVVGEQSIPEQQNHEVPAVVDQQAAKLQEIIGLARNAVSLIGSHEAKVADLQDTTQANVEKAIVDLLNAGFTVEMMEKKQPVRIAMEQELTLTYVMKRSPEYRKYHAAELRKGNTPEFPDEHWFTARKLPAVKIADQTRYNRFSQIKAFIVARIADPTVRLDLYGNSGRKAEKKDSTPATGGQVQNAASDSGKKAKAVDNKVQPNLRGLAPLQKFLIAWCEDNNAVLGCKRHVEAMRQVIDLIEKELNLAK